MKVVSADFLCSADQSRDYPSSDKPEIAFAGRSNVGKSSMINVLLGRKNLVRTSKTPGLTRKINFFLINGSLMLVDLPGYGYASVPLEIRKKWGPMVETYLKERSQLAGVVIIIDSRRGPTDFDNTLITFLKSNSIPFIVALSKMDKLNNSQMATQRRQMKDVLDPDVPIVGFSSLTGLGKNELWKAVRYLIECQKSNKERIQAKD